MTSGLSPDHRRPMAKAVAVNSFFLLVASTLVGAYVLDFFGLSIPAVQVAGGMVVCPMAWSLPNRPDSPGALTRATKPSMAAHALSQRAFYPLTIPLTVGPGSMSVALTLGANLPRASRHGADRVRMMLAPSEALAGLTCGFNRRLRSAWWPQGIRTPVSALRGPTHRHEIRSLQYTDGYADGSV